MDLERDISEAMDTVISVMTAGKVTQAKDEQVEALSHLFLGQDTVCTLPTGYGKSMIFLSMPGVYNALQGHISSSGKLKQTDSPLVVIISPLISLMDTHVKEAQALGLGAYKLPQTKDRPLGLEEVDILFASPEYWTSHEGISFLQTVADRVVLLVTDEVHVAPKW
jgi:superfamily II DNA helicase RecQ